MTDEPFTLPSKAALAAIVREFALDRVQANELELTIRHAAEDVNGFRRTRISRRERREMVEELQAVEAAARSLIAALKAIPRRARKDVLPPDARTAIAHTISSELIAKVIGYAVTDDSGVRLPHAIEAAGLDRGTSIWLAQLEQIHSPIGAFFEEDGHDPGGREPDYVRHHLVVALAKVAPIVLGRRATATAGGPFVRLVASVFIACSLDDTGIERAVERALAVAKRKQ